MENSAITNAAADIEEWSCRYKAHLDRVLGLSPATQRRYLCTANRLLLSLSKDGKVAASRFTAGAVVEFVRADAEPRQGSGPRSTVSATRSFLRFLAASGVVRPGLDAAIPTIRCAPGAALPRRLSESEVSRLLRGCHVGTTKGRRDYALLILLSTLGLRVEEVSRLMLDDIDWLNGSILIRPGKTHSERRLPLCSDVAEALLAYLRDRRPGTRYRHLFIQRLNPFQPYTSAAIAKIVKRLLSFAGVQGRLCGPHIFRHTVASQMINGGATFKEVADLLGHDSLNSTAVYAKLNLASLSQIALPWPGGES